MQKCIQDCLSGVCPSDIYISLTPTDAKQASLVIFEAKLWQSTSLDPARILPDNATAVASPCGLVLMLTTKEIHSFVVSPHPSLMLRVMPIKLANSSAPASYVSCVHDPSCCPSD